MYSFGNSVPIIAASRCPPNVDQLTTSAALGRRLAELLDPESDVELKAEWSFLGCLSLAEGVKEEDKLKITKGGGSRGHGSNVMPSRGSITIRPWTPEETKKLETLAARQNLTLADTLSLLGQTCVDVRLNDKARWLAVPANVWTHTLGGYQVLKKWLSYREYNLLGRALKSEESNYFAQVVRRITAILLLGPALDASYAAILPTATGLRSYTSPEPCSAG